MLRIAPLALFALLASPALASALSSPPIPTNAVDTVADPGELLPERWRRASAGLSLALRSDNDGLRHSALQHIACYGPHLSLSEENMFEIVRLFRDSADERVRLAALGALVHVESGWVTDFLARSARFERSPRMTRLTRAAVIYREGRS